MFAKMFKATSAEQLSLSKISAAWHSTSWLWGLQPSYFNCRLTASCSACAMLVSMGELEMWLADLHVVVHALAAEQTACSTLPEISHALENLTKEKLEALQKHGLKLLQVTVIKESVVYIPCGWVVLMKTTDANLIYGVRKSFFFKTKAAKTSFASARAVMSHTAVGTKMSNVLSFFD